MNNFLHWYYQSYILPQTIDISDDEYAASYQDLLAHLPEESFHSLIHWEEFISIHAFLLGFRTAGGLSAAGALPFTGTSVPDASTPPQSPVPGKTR